MLSVAHSSPRFDAPSTSAAQRLTARTAELLHRHRGTLLAWFGFLSFMPYPALGIGSASALQMGHGLILAMLAAPVLAVPWLRRPFNLYPLLVLPILISLSRVALAQPQSLPMCVHASSAVILSLTPIVLIQLYAPRHSIQLLVGIAWAMVIHAAVGAWQMYGFAHGQFPLLWLFVNPSFATVQGNVESLVKYIQRPCGIFPEASAMAASLAPFVVLFFAEACGLVSFRQSPAPWQRRLFFLAGCGGLSLIILSRSGHTVITLAAVACCGLVWLRRSRATASNVVLLMFLFGIIVPTVMVLASYAIGQRFQEGGVSSDSWSERSASLVIGFDIFKRLDPASQILGIGMDLMAPGLWDEARIAGIYSVLLAYVYETGIIGALVVAWVGAELARVWRLSRFNGAFLLFFIVWLVGILLTTSYSQLLTLWVAMGWLSIWPVVCAPPAPISLRRSRPLVRSTTKIPHQSSWHAQTPG